jgi:hypothetical protein
MEAIKLDLIASSSLLAKVQGPTTKQTILASNSVRHQLHYVLFASNIVIASSVSIFLRKSWKLPQRAVQTQ